MVVYRLSKCKGEEIRETHGHLSLSQQGSANRPSEDLVGGYLLDGLCPVLRFNVRLEACREWRKRLETGALKVEGSGEVFLIHLFVVAVL